MNHAQERQVKQRCLSCSCDGDDGEWYRRHGEMIRGFLQARLGDPVAADDGTSETFLRAFASRHRFTCHGQGVRPWLFTIARNIAHDYRKPAWRRLETPSDAVEPDTHWVQTPEEVILRRDLLAVLARALGQLTVDQARCVWLRFFADLSVKETATFMHRDENAVRALQYRAIRKLGFLLEGVR